jgi:hypothetical protein
MEGQDTRSRGRLYRRRFRRHSRAVVAVIGTFMALLIFFALFGVFLTQYLPIWMTEDEQQLAEQVQTSMAQLKAYVDLQASLGGSPVYTVPFPTVSQSIPLLTQPTDAIITFLPFTAGIYGSLSMSPGPGNPMNIPVSTYAENVSLGRLVAMQPDRYYSPQTLSFEGDGVVQSQSYTKQVLEYPPVINFNQSGNAFGVTISIVQLVGAATQSSGVGTQEISSHYVFSQAIYSSSTADALTSTYVIGTQYPYAWGTYLNTVLSASNLTATHYALTVCGKAVPAGGAVPTCSSSSAAGQVVKVQFTNLGSITFVFSELRIVLGEGIE